MERFDVEAWYKDEESSVALVVLNGVGETVVNHASSNVYEIISGDGFFIFPDSSMVQGLFEGSIVRITSGVAYRSEGDLVMICTSEPPFDPKSVTVVE